jgi:hydroxymethylpyrimidine pyrophosphatase-like HAD family hydrolase
LDGTVLGSDAGESAFRLWAEGVRGRVRLAYVTGRSIESVRELIASGRLPEADYASTAVGTEVWDLRDPVNRLGRHYRELADPAWPALQYRERGHSDATPLQGPEGQGPFKASFFWDGHPDSLQAFHGRLQGLQDHRVHVTAGQYLDVLPHCFNKGQALRFLAAAAGVDLKRVVAAGDMEHDEEMLRTAGHAIVPANALPPLRAALQDSAAFFAQGREALGLLEGLMRLGLT